MSSQAKRRENERRRKKYGFSKLAALSKSAKAALSKSPQ